MDYTSSTLLDPQGREVWSGRYQERSAAIESLRSQNGRSASLLAALTGSRHLASGERRPSAADITLQCEELGFISKRGTARGFFVLPPLGAFFERCVSAFNDQHLSDIGAIEVRFPAVYSMADDRIAELTESYAKFQRIFKVAAKGRDLALSYAADPSLLSWLAGTRLDADRLPLTIVSPVEVFRRFRSGEVGPMNRTYQYSLPDLHRFALLDEGEAECLALLQTNAESVRFWTDDAFVQFVDLTEDFFDDHPSLAASMARKAGCFTLVNRFAKQPRYYRMRSGLCADAGSEALMLFNIQWDEENPRRFDIRSGAGRSLCLLHSNALCPSGLMMLLVGRAMAGLAPQRLPPECSLNCIAIQPARSEDVSYAHEYDRKLADAGLRPMTMQAPERGLGKALSRLRQQWAPAIVVVGRKEADGGRHLVDIGLPEPLGDTEFIERNISRIRRCTPSYVPAWHPMPFD